MAVLADDVYSAGSYEVQWDASSFPSGIYFAEAEFDGLTSVKRMALVK